MPCTTCNTSSPIVVAGLPQLLSQINPCGCESNTVGCPSTIDSGCVQYTGPNLACSNILTNDTMHIALQKIDTLLCASAGDYSLYNTACLTPILTQKQFVESVSALACATSTSLATLLSTTLPAYEASVAAQFASILTPGTTSSCSPSFILPPLTSLQGVLQHLSNALCDIYGNQLNLAAVPWNTCFTVNPTPITISDAFGVVVSEICSLKALIGSGGGGAVLPIFDNTGSCLPVPLTTTDTLAVTVNKVKARLCQTPVFDINGLAWNCVAKPSTVTTDLQSAFNAVLARLDSLSQLVPTFSSDFDVAATDPLNPCAGKTIALSTSPVADRFVASTTNDTTPGTLQTKLTAGTGIELDFTTVPGTVIVNNIQTASTNDGKVFVNGNDSTADYLFAKIEIAPPSEGISISAAVDTTTNPASYAIELGVTVDLSALFTAMINQLTLDPVLYAQFCNAMSQCPSPCAPPSNVTISFPGSSSTTTTTTTVAPTTTTSSTTTTTTT